MADEHRPLPDQLTAAFEDLRYPVETPADLAVSYPSWANTRFEADEWSATPRELLVALPDEGYPYATAEELVEAVSDDLRDAGVLE